MSEKKVLLSIIIPAYNCENYLEKCIDSIIFQELESAEIILVDDGSTDQTSGICDNLSCKSSLIRAYHKANEGQGIARNYAMQFARGEYITFVDADDITEKQGYSKALEVMMQTKADLGIFGWSVFDDEDRIDKVFIQQNDPSIIVTNYEDVLDDMSRLRTKFGSGVWNKIYKKSILEKYKIRFISERQVISEDYLFNFVYLSYCKIIITSDIHIYKYRKNQTSFSHRYQSDYLYRLENFASFIGSSELYSRDVIDKTNIKTFSLIKTCIIQEARFKSVSEGVAKIRQICQSTTTQRIVEGLSSDYLDTMNFIAKLLIKNKLAMLLYIFYRLK